MSTRSSNTLWTKAHLQRATNVSLDVSYHITSNYVCVARLYAVRICPEVRLLSNFLR